MSYIASNKISIYPSSIRGNQTTEDSGLQTRYRQSRLFSEGAYTNYVHMMSDKDTFMITKEIVPSALDSVLEFCIKGYYIKVDSLNAVKTAIGGSPSDIYAAVSIDSTTDSYFPYIEGQDVAGVFEGVSFTSTQPQSGDYLHLLHKENSTWIVPAESLKKFDLTSLGFAMNSIDCGVLQ